MPGGIEKKEGFIGSLCVFLGFLYVFVGFYRFLLMWFLSFFLFQWVCLYRFVPHGVLIV